MKFDAFRAMKRVGFSLIAASMACVVLPSQAQVVVREHLHIPMEQTDAWAMGFVCASSLPMGLGEAPKLETMEWMLSSELNAIPHLSTAEQQVGLGGVKAEDLNKSPVFGRVRIWLGLPAQWSLDLGFTPPLEINGAKAKDIVSLGLSRRWDLGERWSLSARAFAQHGVVSGDITCSADIAGSTDPLRNPFRCLSPSDDRLHLNLHGLEFTSGIKLNDAGDWRAHLALGSVHLEPEVNIRAEQANFSNRTTLTASAWRPYFKLGVQKTWHEQWDLSLAWYYLPLAIDRPEQDRHTEAFSAPQVSVSYRFQ